jgi:hypothetical protein
VCWACEGVSAGKAGVGSIAGGTYEKRGQDFPDIGKFRDFSDIPHFGWSDVVTQA